MRGLWPRKHPPAMPDQQYCTPSDRIAAQALSALYVDCLVNTISIQPYTSLAYAMPCLSI